MTQFMFYFASLQTRYLERGQYRSSPLPRQILHIDLNIADERNWLSDNEFLRKYRVTREGFTAILNRIKDHPVFQRGRRGPEQAPVEFQLMVFLNYIGTEGSGSSNATGRFVFHVSQGTAELFRKRVVKAICSLRGEFITWPDEAERSGIRRRILDKSGLPFCVGMMDGTLFPLAFAPESTDAPDYFGRKHSYALSTLVVCDDQRLIRYYLSGWPGSAHDNRIFRNSAIFKNPEKYFLLQEYIIGDSAFSNTWFSVTTYKNPPNGNLPREYECFNTVLSSPRVISEHTIGILKGRFPWLRHIRMKITKDKASIIPILVTIDACIVLHNMLMKSNEPIDDDWLEDFDSNQGNWVFQALGAPVPNGSDDDLRRTQLTYYVNEQHSWYN
jgi:hypothetical protein